MKRPLLLAAFTAALAAAAAGAFLLPAPASAAPTTASISLAVKSDAEHAKKGSDGNWHDAFLPARFTVHTGQKVTAKPETNDNAIHTFTSARLGLNVTLRPGTSCAPSATTFAFTAPKAGPTRGSAWVNATSWR